MFLAPDQELPNKYMGAGRVQQTGGRGADIQVTAAEQTKPKLRRALLQRVKDCQGLSGQTLYITFNFNI